MSWSYSGDPTSSKIDECRFLIGDTNINAPIMQDEEIQYIITQAGSNDDKLKYDLFSRAATVFARDIKRSLGPQSEDPTARLSFFKEQMNLYKARTMAGGLSLPRHNYPKVFRKGMHNNPPWPPGK